MKKKKKKVGIIILTAILIFFTVLFVTPIVFTMCNSFMGSSEIAANYGPQTVVQKLLYQIK